VETGTSLTVEATLAGLERLGIAPEAVGHILCTHIHVDHAGGVGYLARALPRAHVYIHSATATFLTDPTRLLSSARRAVGEEIWPLHGDMLPLEPDRIRPAEALRLDLGRGVILEALPTPGHSPDHVAYRDLLGGGLFVGDAAGLSLPGYGLVRPVTPPPAYDLAAQQATLTRLRSLDISRLYFTHFGPSDAVESTLATLDDGLQELAAGVLTAFAAGEGDLDALADRLLPVPPGLNSAAELVARAWGRMSVAGLWRYYTKQQSAK
jgi:glyoxylase-like metal-dependent hydrolase (beta-lactamase superfamily II)